MSRSDGSGLATVLYPLGPLLFGAGLALDEQARNFFPSYATSFGGIYSMD